MSDKSFLIWSEEHNAWWRPGRWGYTASMKQAGRYTEEQAFTIAREANSGGTFNEVPVEVTAEMRLACELPSGGGR